MSIPDRVWTKRRRLNPSEWDRVGLHAYHTERILEVAGLLRAAAQLAALHHERLDGSGYHRGLGAAALPAAARLLTGAEVYQSLLEERVWRPALTREEAATEVRRMGRRRTAGRRRRA